MDLPGAFLHTLTDKKVIMILKGVLCELMCKVAPKIYRKYVTKDKRDTPILDMELYKSLYGLLQFATVLQEIEEGVNQIWVLHKPV